MPTNRELDDDSRFVGVMRARHSHVLPGVTPVTFPPSPDFIHGVTHGSERFPLGLGAKGGPVGARRTWWV
jgi:hypothetical protein